MGGEWSPTTIGDQVTLQRGFDITKKEQREGFVPVVSSGGTNSWHDKAAVAGPGVVLGRKGVVGSVYFIDRDFWPHDTTLWVKDFKGNAPHFVYYFFVWQAPWLASLDVGSANPTLNRNHVHPHKVTWPPLKEQKAIAHILSSLDDKIELNRQMNATLEAMAQALFKSWFVDFDPVIDNALAAGNPIPEPLQARAAARQALGEQRKPLPPEIQRQFPSRFVFTEELGWIPEGWRVAPILEEADLLSGGTPKTDVERYWNGDVPWASAKDVSQCGEAFLVSPERKITKAGLQNSSTKLIDKFSTVIVSRGATTGRLAMFGGTMAMNQTCYALRTKNETPFFLYCHARKFISTLVHAAHGSVFDTITTKTFKSTSVLLPSTDATRCFERRVGTQFERLLANLLETATLERLRDTLLPKLLSGELRVPEAEKQVAEVV